MSLDFLYATVLSQEIFICWTGWLFSMTDSVMTFLRELVLFCYVETFGLFGTNKISLFYVKCELKIPLRFFLKNWKSKLHGEEWFLWQHFGSFSDYLPTSWNDIALYALVKKWNWSVLIGSCAMCVSFCYK